MKTSKLVIGIFSIVLSMIVTLQSCAAGLGNALSDNGEVSGSAGLILSMCMLVAGIVGIATRNGSKGGAYAAGIIYLFGSLLGFANAGSYKDLNIWAALTLIFAIIFILGTALNKKSKQESKVICKHCGMPMRVELETVNGEPHRIAYCDDCRKRRDLDKNK